MMRGKSKRNIYCGSCCCSLSMKLAKYCSYFSYDYAKYYVEGNTATLLKTYILYSCSAATDLKTYQKSITSLAHGQTLHQSHRLGKVITIH